MSGEKPEERSERGIKVASGGKVAPRCKAVTKDLVAFFRDAHQGRKGAGFAAEQFVGNDAEVYQTVLLFLTCADCSLVRTRGRRIQVVRVPKSIHFTTNAGQSSSEAAPQTSEV